MDASTDRRASPRERRLLFVWFAIPIVVGAPLVFWLFWEIGPGGGGAAAIVNGERVTFLRLAVAERYPSPVRGPLREPGEAALDALVREVLLDQEARRRGIAISDRQLTDAIAADPRFDPPLRPEPFERYEQRIGERFGRTVPQFEAEYRVRLRIEKLRDAVGGEATLAALATRLAGEAVVAR